MTELNEGPVEPPIPIWVAEQPLDQQQAHYAAPSPFQHGPVPPAVRPVRTMWPLIAMAGVVAVAVAVAVAAPFFRNPGAAHANDEFLKGDLLRMAQHQDFYVTNHPGEKGLAVPAAGGKVIVDGYDFHVTSDNVIAVAVGPTGYCVSAYNARASRATSPTASMTYRSDTKVVQTVPGVCVVPVLLQRMARVDEALKGDLLKTATRQDAYITQNPGKTGFAVAATSPGGTVTTAGVGFTLSPGNVVAVVVGPDGYCVSGYNALATRATSSTASMKYLAGSKVVQTIPSVCAPLVLKERLTRVDELLRGDLLKMAAVEHTYITENPGQRGYGIGMNYFRHVRKVPTNSGHGGFTLSPGNMIAVKVGPDGYCVSGYNARASRATSPTASMTYHAGSNVVQTAPGTC